MNVTNQLMTEKEVIRKIRLKLREYFPNLQKLIDQNVITKNDWLFFGMIQLNLVKCFLDTPEKIIRKSKKQIKQIIKFYDLEVKTRNYILKSNTIQSENNIDLKNIKEQIVYYSEHKEYWVNRQNSNELYFNYELFMFLYYKWMNNFEFEIDNTLNLMLDIMVLTNFYRQKFFTIEKLRHEREILLSQMKVSSLLLINKNDDFQNIIDVGMDIELIDVRTLLPFDINHIIGDSIKKTNRLLIVDEDVPGGASAFILHNVLQIQKSYYHLDSEPRCLTAHAHRPAYASDGDYFSKPNAEDIFDEIYSMMRESNPEKFPSIY